VCQCFNTFLLRQCCHREMLECLFLTSFFFLEGLMFTNKAVDCFSGVI
jgi:hypothetical protein